MHAQYLRLFILTTVRDGAIWAQVRLEAIRDAQGRPCLATAISLVDRVSAAVARADIARRQRLSRSITMK